MRYHPAMHAPPPTAGLRLAQAARGVLTDAAASCRTLFKAMVPVIILVKVLQELGWVAYAAAPLGPVMELMGLPAETGLVWATAMLVNLYAALVVFMALLPTIPTPTTAQVTVLALVMLVAHGLPLELEVARRSGGSLLRQLAIRVLGAVAFGLALHLVLEAAGALAQPATMLWRPAPAPDGLAAWAWREILNLGKVFGIVVVLMALMRLLDRAGVTGLFTRLLAPVLRFMGIGEKAAGISVVGLVMGLVYGAGLIIAEARSGRVPPRDVEASLTLMGLCHAIIEDTLLMTLIGASAWGTFGARLAFTLLAVAALTRLGAVVARRKVLREAA